jgi:hypothetical protein
MHGARPGNKGLERDTNPWAPGPIMAWLALLWGKEEAEMRLRKGRKQAGMVLMAVIAALVLGGVPARATGGPAGGGLDWAWGWVRSLWEAADEGWHIDPNGTPRATSDEGPHIDPDGLSVSSPEVTPGETPNNSMAIDPNG